MRSCFALGLAMLAALTASIPAQGQSSPSSPPQPPAYRSTTRAVVVDVVVSKGDDAIPGLHKQDFEVLEDGKPQIVDFFEEHSSRSLPLGAATPLPQMPPGVFTNVPPAPENDSVNVLLLDSLNTEKQDQSFVRQQALDFLKKLHPGTRVAIFTLGSRLRFIQGFTADTSKLLAAMEEAKAGTPARDAAYHSASDTADDKEEVQTMLLELGGRDGGVDALESTQAGNASLQYGNRVNMTFEALQALARYLAAVPGRKNLLWFASSYPVTVFPTAAQKQTITNQRGYLSQVRATADLLTVSKVAVYPINAQGMMNFHAAEADSHQLPDPYTAYINEGNDRAAVISAMEQLASDTGGKAFFNTNDLGAAIEKAIADGAHFYTLVYTPTNKKLDGSYRRIEVKVVDGKYRLAYRRGYNADTDSSLEASQTEANPLHRLMMHGMPASTQVLYAVRVVPSSPQPSAGSPHAGKNPKLFGPTTRYAIDFMIRWTDLKFAAGPDGSHSGKVQIEVLAFDRDGKAVNWTGGIQAMNIKPDIFAAVEKSGVPAHIDFDLPTGEDIYLETGVYDWETGKAGTLEVPLRFDRVAKVAAQSPQQTDSKRN